MAATLAIRSNDMNLVYAAQAAKRAQAAHKVQKPNNQATLASLASLVGKVHGDHNAAISALCAHMDNTDEAPIMVYAMLNRTFKTNRPNFTSWVNGR